MDVSRNITKTETYLLRFLSNLVFGETHALKNRELHIHFVAPAGSKLGVNDENEGVNDIFEGVTLKIEGVKEKLRVELKRILHFINET